MASDSPSRAQPDESCVGFFRELQNVDVKPIQDYLAKCTSPFEASELHVPDEGRNVIDLSLRKSSFRRLTEDSLFKLVEPIVARLSQADPLLTYNLVRNDITHIKYVKGGFFRKHSDYLTVTSNMIEEFALLVCVTPDELASDVSGGKTVLYFGESNHVSDATTTPGCALAFRKDVEHEATMLEAGEKHIITANLWACRKYVDAQCCTSVLLITFPGHDSDASVLDPDASDSMQAAREVNPASLERLATERTYAIPMEEAKRSPALANVIAEASANSGNVLLHECKECTFEEFDTIFRILRRMHVSALDVQRNHALIQRYGLEALAALHGLQPEEASPDSPDPSDSKYMITIYMMDASLHKFEVSPSDSVLSVRTELQKRTGKEGLRLVMADGAAEVLQDTRTLSDCGSPAELNAVKVRLKIDEYQALGLSQDEMHKLVESPSQSALESRGSDVIVCASLARSEVVASVAKAAGLPFVLFQSICIEGTLFDHRARGSIRMRPGLICLGDCRQVLSCHRLRWWHEDWEVDDDSRLGDLSMALLPQVDIAALSHMLIEDPGDGYSDDSDDPAEPPPRVDIIKTVRGIRRAACLNDKKRRRDVSELFHLNAAGQSCFNKVEAAATVEHLESINFRDQIVERLKQVPFELPQESDRRNKHFCNEGDVYSKMNILLVSGVVRLLPEVGTT